MSLKLIEDTFKGLLEEMLFDLQKAERGNKTAAQRVRTKSVQFSKIAKQYRKISMQTVKQLSMKKKALVKRKKFSSKAKQEN